MISSKLLEFRAYHSNSCGKGYGSHLTQSDDIMGPISPISCPCHKSGNSLQYSIAGIDM